MMGHNPMYQPESVETVERLDHDQALEYSLNLLEMAMLDEHYDLARTARESIAAIWRHKTSDFGGMFVAMVMHGKRIDADCGLYLERGMTYHRDGDTYLATWSLHS
jgi:hypothetical protein